MYPLIWYLLCSANAVMSFLHVDFTKTQRVCLNWLRIKAENTGLGLWRSVRVKQELHSMNWLYGCNCWRPATQNCVNRWISIKVSLNLKCLQPSGCAVTSFWKSQIVNTSCKTGSVCRAHYLVRCLLTAHLGSFPHVYDNLPEHRFKMKMGRSEPVRTSLLTIIIHRWEWF